MSVSTADESTRRCQRCGGERGRTVEVCPHCGAELPTGDGQESTVGREDADDGGWSRRLLLLGGAAVAVGGVGAATTGTLGVLGGSADDDHYEVGTEAWQNPPIRPTEEGDLVTGVVTLETGAFAPLAFTVDDEDGLTALVDVTDGGPVDLFCVRDADVGAYRDGESVSFVSDLSREAIEHQALYNGPVSPGKYWMVLDNSPVYGATPREKTTAEVKVGTTLL